MNNNFFMLKEKYNIDIFTDFILHNDDTFYFYLDLNEDTLFNAQFHQIKGDFPIALKAENKLKKKNDDEKKSKKDINADRRNVSDGKVSTVQPKKPKTKKPTKKKVSKVSKK